ncbi:MAG: CDP-diacylglycerol--glycerol-3-phosphate 3-phosphatidyltransferase [Chloroflexota bacterium]|nr:CDP-diacylglycerol--glycerol-3-phosphate 3-phosphatidyltransferase [Chloroflexota bacterium]
MSVANALSWSRIFATPLVMFLLWADGWSPGYILAAIVFAVAEITDLLDGYFARRQNTVSNLGIFLDLTADKLFTAGVLVMMAEKQILSAWLIAIILGREFLITGVRTYAAAEGVVIPAGKWGKRKTALTAISLTWLIVWADAGLKVRTNGLLYEAAQNWKIGEVKFFDLFLNLSWPLVYLMVVITVYSGYLYLRDAAYLFVDDPNKREPRPNSSKLKVPSSKS